MDLKNHSILVCLIFAFHLINLLKSESELAVEEDHVFVLNSKNFDDFLDNNEFTVVFFYAPWCGHCTNMKPFYHEAGKILKEDESLKPDKKIALAKVDATIETELASRFQLQGYPTIKIFRKGIAYEYDGPRRDGQAIVKYLIGEASNEWKPPVSHVVVLSNSNFTQWVENYELSLVEFYSPNCGHCIRLAPNYEKAAKQLAQEKVPIPLAKVDATVESELSRKYQIQGFPTMLVFRKGRHYEYKGGREVHEIVEFMLKARASSSKEVKTFAQFDSNVKKATEVYVLGLFDNKDNNLYQVYDLFAAKYSEDLKLFHTFDSDHFQKYFKSSKVKSQTILVYYHDLAVPKKEPKYRIFDKENANIEDLEEFVFKISLPLISFLSPLTKPIIYDKILPICYVFYDVDIELKSHIIYTRDKFVPLAQKYKDVRFVMVNETENSDLAKSYHLEEVGSDTNLVCVDKRSKIYINEDDSLDQDDLESFVKKFLAGKLKAYVRSEVVPKDNEKKLVKKVVGKTIENLVKTSKKDLFIAFTGHMYNLDTFETNYNALAAKYAKEKSISFGKFDTTLNDYPDNLFQPNKYKPTVYYISSRDKTKPVEFVYEDSSKLSDLISFVEKNVHNDGKTEL